MLYAVMKDANIGARKSNANLAPRFQPSAAQMVKPPLSFVW